MLCTAAEIEEKRRQAKEKLLKKQKLNNAALHQSNSTGNLPSKAPAESKFFPRSESMPSRKSVFDNSPQRQKFKPFCNSPMNNNTKFNLNAGINDQRIQATCILIKLNRFQVMLTRYFNAAIDVMRTIPSKSYNPKTTHWEFSLEDYELLLKKLAALNTQLSVNKLPIWIFKLPRNLQKNTCYDFDAIDEELRNTLMPFQEEAICFAIDRKGRCFIADEMGLGKTIQALGIASYFREDFPVLIVTTASTCSNWEQTIRKYLPSISPFDVHILSQKNSYICNPSVIIVSYDTMHRHCSALLKQKCGICIFDESHNLKNYKTKYYKAAMDLSKVAKRVVLLSGTPAMAKPAELFTQLSILNETFFGTFREFSKRYCDGKVSAYGWDASGQSNLEELQIVLESQFMIRRTKDAISALALPEKMQEIVQLKVSERDLNVEDKAQLDVMSKTVIKDVNEILQFFHKSARIKIPAVRMYISQVLAEETKKMIIFAHHKEMLDAIEKILIECEKEFIRIDGSTPDRQKLVERFQIDKNCVCALLSIKAANAGITLTAAEIVIFTELDWTPSILAQAEARAHRIGQTKPVTIRYLIAPRTIDDHIWPMLQSKQRTLQEMKLITESYGNIQPAKRKATPEKSVTKITSYFSPKTASKRPKLGNEACSRTGQLKERKINLGEIFSSELFECDSPPKVPVANLGPSNNGSSKTNKTDTCDELNDDLDDFFRNFSTQQIISVPAKIVESNQSNNSEDNDLFNDDMDEILKTFTY